MQSQEATLGDWHVARFPPRASLAHRGCVPTRFPCTIGRNVVMPGQDTGSVVVTAAAPHEQLGVEPLQPDQQLEQQPPPSPLSPLQQAQKELYFFQVTSYLAAVTNWQSFVPPPSADAGLDDQDPHGGTEAFVPLKAPAFATTMPLRSKDPQPGQLLFLSATKKAYVDNILAPRLGSKAEAKKASSKFGKERVVFAVARVKCVRRDPGRWQELSGAKSAGPRSILVELKPESLCWIERPRKQLQVDLGLHENATVKRLDEKHYRGKDEEAAKVFRYYYRKAKTLVNSRQQAGSPDHIYGFPPAPNGMYKQQQLLEPCDLLDGLLSGPGKGNATSATPETSGPDADGSAALRPAVGQAGGASPRTPWAAHPRPFTLAPPSAAAVGVAPERLDEPDGCQEPLGPHDAHQRGLGEDPGTGDSDGGETRVLHRRPRRRPRDRFLGKSDADDDDDGLVSGGSEGLRKRQRCFGMGDWKDIEAAAEGGDGSGGDDGALDISGGDDDGALHIGAAYRETGGGGAKVEAGSRRGPLLPCARTSGQAGLLEKWRDGVSDLRLEEGVAAERVGPQALHRDAPQRTAPRQAAAELEEQKAAKLLAEVECRLAEERRQRGLEDQKAAKMLAEVERRLAEERRQRGLEDQKAAKMLAEVERRLAEEGRQHELEKQEAAKLLAEERRLRVEEKQQAAKRIELMKQQVARSQASVASFMGTLHSALETYDRDLTEGDEAAKGVDARMATDQ